VLAIPQADLAALIVATAFAAGLNVYATVATLGVLARAGWVVLPPPLAMLADPWVIAVSISLFGIEMVADKVPAFDLVWNALQTFVRVPVAAVLAYEAARPLSPGLQLLAAAAGAAIAFAAHAAKTTARVAVTPSPEPFSNIALSVAEDGAAVGLTWLATRHPFVAAAIALTLVAIIIALARVVVRAFRRLVRARRGDRPAV
jgi:hypothetical protein